jgi:FAD dependent oxidoreductase TIGR03364
MHPRPFVREVGSFARSLRWRLGNGGTMAVEASKHMSNQRVVVVGAGIVGLSFAFSAAERGAEVTVFERHDAAVGASIRNFGMVWPIGQPAGQLYAIARAARERWGLLASQGACWLSPCGSVHAAHHDDEWAVLQEFAASAPGAGIPCRLLGPEETLQTAPGVKPEGLRGSLHSDSEACVNPRRAMAGLAAWLTTRRGVRIEFGRTVAGFDGGDAVVSGGERCPFDLAVVCGGADIDTIFPGLHASLGLRRCKLQMLKTVAQPDGWRLGPHVASGLTLRHYRSFEGCPSLATLRQRIAATKPELDRLGIHVMASQHDDGGVVLGDSHEYDADVDAFDKPLIDDLILRELREVIAIPDWTIASRWHGVYSKHPSRAWVEAEPIDNVKVVTGLGGNGMSLSLGLAEHLMRSWTGAAHATA